MRIFVKIFGLLFIISSLNAQNYGRLMNRGELDPETNANQLVEEQPDFAIEHEVDPDTYILGPGDEIGLDILTSENVTMLLRVTPTGDLFIPSVGVIHVSGATISEIKPRVQDFIHKQAYPGSKIDLALLNLRRFKIPVIGAVITPGFVTINPLDRLSDVIKASGGFHQLAREFEIQVIRSTGEVETINYWTYYRTGDMKHNPVFQEGDQIVIPFGSLDKEGVVLRGAVVGSGYDIIEPGETLGSFLQRRVKFNQNADLESVLITRSTKGTMNFIRIEPKDLFATKLTAGETIDILWEKGVMVNGFVLTPGAFAFFPGYLAADYINMAGGNTPNGNPSRCLVMHRDGTIDQGQLITIRRGDVIVVPRTFKDSIIGDTSALQIIVSLATVYLAFVASGR